MGGFTVSICKHIMRAFVLGSMVLMPNGAFAEEAPFEISVESDSVVIMTAVDSDLVFKNIVLNKGHCKPFTADYNCRSNCDSSFNPYHSFRPVAIEYGAKLRILSFDTGVTEQALDSGSILGATIRGVHDCTILEIDIVTNKGSWSSRVHAR